MQRLCMGEGAEGSPMWWDAESLGECGVGGSWRQEGLVSRLRSLVVIWEKWYPLKALIRRVDSIGFAFRKVPFN